MTVFCAVYDGVPFCCSVYLLLCFHQDNFGFTPLCHFM